MLIKRVPLIIAPSERERRRDWKRPPRGWSPQGGQGIAYTNHGVAATSSTAATTTGAKTVTAVAGDTIIVCVALAGGTSPSVSDSAGNTYSLLVGPTTNTDTCWMFATRNIPGSVTSVTVTWTTAARWAVAIDTWSGVTGFGVTATNTG